MQNTEKVGNSRGFVYAATGSSIYVDLAIRSARSLKLQCPDIPIDLYTDQDVHDPVFSKVHKPEESWFRVKIDALINSRFQETVYIDADTYVIDDISDIFYLFQNYDICACHDPGRNSEHGSAILDSHFPESFPTLNGGLIGITKSEKSQEFLQLWKQTIQSRNQLKDQPSFRELIWQSNLHLSILPPEYNIMFLRWLDVLGYKQGIPKIIHSPKLHQHQKNNHKPINGLIDLLGTRRTIRLLKLLKRAGRDLPADWILFGEAGQGTNMKQKMIQQYIQRTFGEC